MKDGSAYTNSGPCRGFSDTRKRGWTRCVIDDCGASHFSVPSLTLTRQTLIPWVNFTRCPIARLVQAKPAFSSGLMILIHLMNASGRKTLLLSCQTEDLTGLIWVGTFLEWSHILLKSLSCFEPVMASGLLCGSGASEAVTKLIEMNVWPMHRTWLWEMKLSEPHVFYWQLLKPLDEGEWQEQLIKQQKCISSLSSHCLSSTGWIFSPLFKTKRNTTASLLELFEFLGWSKAKKTWYLHLNQTFHLRFPNFSMHGLHVFMFCQQLNAYKPVI